LEEGEDGMTCNACAQCNETTSRCIYLYTKMDGPCSYICAMRLEKVFPYELPSSELPLKVLNERKSLAERRDKHSVYDMEKGCAGSIIRIDHGGVRASAVNGNRAVI